MSLLPVLVSLFTKASVELATVALTGLKVVLIPDSPCQVDVTFTGGATATIPVQDLLLLNSNVTNIKITAGATLTNVQVAVSGI